MLIYPALIYSDGNIRDFFKDYMNFHTVAFHNLVIFAFVLILTLDLHTPDGRKDQLAPVAVTAVFCLISAIVANILQVNYASFYECNIAPLEAIRVNLQGPLGYATAQIIYVCIVAVLTVLFTWGMYWLYRLIRKLTAIKVPVTL